MKVLVCGGRYYDNYPFIYKYLDAFRMIYPISLVIEGGAMGADWYAKVWAMNNDIPHKEFKADWINDGKSAGYIRNKRMLDEGKPDVVIAFPGGKGTANMVSLAGRYLIKTYFPGQK